MRVLPVMVKDTLARQCHAIDDGRFDSYADTFTSDAVFDNRLTGEVMIGRAAIVHSARVHRANRDDQGVWIRHYMFGTRLGDSTHQRAVSRAVSTTLILRSGPGLLATVQCEDDLVEDSGVLRVAYRTVRPCWS